MKQLRIYYPVKPLFVGQKFGENLTPVYAQLGMKGHNGWDIAASDGTPVRAAHDGTITYAGEDGASGLLIVIRTDEKYEYESDEAYFKSLYCHLKKGSFRVTSGDKVKTGDIIALADNTGMSTGSHLHFGLKPVLPGEAEWQWGNIEQGNGYNGAIDPEPYWTGIHAEDVPRAISLYGALIPMLQAIISSLKAGR